MMKTLMTYAGAAAGTAVFVAMLLTVAAPHAEPMRSGVGNDRTGMTVNNAGMMTTSTVVPGHAEHGRTGPLKPNDDITPAAGAVSGAPSSGNTYTTTGKRNRHDIQRGQ